MIRLALAALLLLATPAWADLDPPSGTITIKEWPTRGWSQVVIRTSGEVGTDLVFLHDALGIVALVGPDSPETGFDEAPALVTSDASGPHTRWWTVFTRVLVPRSGSILVQAQTAEEYDQSVSSTFRCRVTKPKNPRTTVCKP